MRKRKTTATAFSGIAIALIVILLFIAGIIDVFDYTASAICGLIVTFILVEFGTSFAVAVYTSSTVLCLIMIPSKIAAVLYIAFCGWYSFIKPHIEKIKEPFGTIFKFLVFNAVLSIIVLLTLKLFMIEKISTFTVIILVIISNFTFFLYDVLITKLIWLYVHIYRKKLKFLK